MSEFKVLVPLTLHGREAEAVLLSSGDIEVVYALSEADRVYGGGALGSPSEQRKQASEITWERIPEMDAVCALPGPRFITRELIGRAEKLRVVFIIGAGFDSIDVDAATECGIVVVNARGNNSVSVSEHAVGLMLALVRRIAVSDRLAHNERRAPHLSEVGGFPPILSEKTVALLGFGQIGRAVGRICALGFGMRVQVYDPYFTPGDPLDFEYELVSDLNELLSAADIVSVHSPLTDETRYMISTPQLKAMKPTAFLINTSRGATVDSDALAQALRDGEIAGAGLDVTDPEPLPAGHQLFDLENVVFTPHSAGASPELVTKAGIMATTSTVDALHGVKPATLVNPEVWPAYLQRWYGGDNGHS